MSSHLIENRDCGMDGIIKDIKEDGIQGLIVDKVGDNCVGKTRLGQKKQTYQVDL